MRFRVIVSCMCLCTAGAFTASAQYATSSPYAPLTIPTTGGASSCVNTWYDPEIFLLPDTVSLGLLAQGGAPNPCQTLPYDAFFRATRNPSGSWSTPAAGACPAFKGEYIRCTWTGGANAGPIASPSVVRLNNVNSASGKRYFMAFVGGNADYIHGKLYWAMSDDASNWTVYSGSPTENWRPILQAKYERSSSQPRSTLPCAPPSAIGQVMMAYESPYIYVYVLYYHPYQPECATDPRHETTACQTSPYVGYDRALSSVVFRFTYDPNHPFGFSSDLRILNRGAWQTHSGKLVWPYDRDSANNQLPADAGNPVMQAYDSGDYPSANFKFGNGDIKYGNGRWLHVVSFGDTPPRTMVQTASCLNAAVCRWSNAEALDVSPIRAVYGNLVDLTPSGIYYGPLRKADGTFTGTHWWIWVPVPTGNQVCYDGQGQRSVFAGLSLAPAQLCTPDVPCGP